MALELNKIIGDKYDREARMYPTVIVLIPFFILQYFYLNKVFPDWSDFVHKLRTVAAYSIPVVLFYLFNNRVQLISKFLFESKIFKGGAYFPTTDFLMYSDGEYSEARKKQIRDKVKEDFGIKLPTKLEEQNDENESRKRINEAVTFIRNKARHGRFVISKNINYGFTRNLVGGSLLGLLFSVINLVVFYWVDYQKEPLIFSSVWFFFYLITVIVSRPIIIYTGREYARKLYDQYLDNV